MECGPSSPGQVSLSRTPLLQAHLNKEESKTVSQSMVQVLNSKAGHPNILVTYKIWDDQLYMYRQEPWVSEAICVN